MGFPVVRTVKSSPPSHGYLQRLTKHQSPNLPPFVEALARAREVAGQELGGERVEERGHAQVEEQA